MAHCKEPPSSCDLNKTHEWPLYLLTLPDTHPLYSCSLSHKLLDELFILIKKNWTNCLLIWCDQTFRLLYQVPEFWSTLEHWNSGTALHSGASRESFSWGTVCLSSWLIPVHSTRFFLALFIPPYKRKAIFWLTVETLTGVMVGTFSLLQVIVPLSLSQ